MQSERQLACYSLLEDNGNETGMIIVVGRTKKKDHFPLLPTSAGFNSIHIFPLSGPADWSFVCRKSFT